MPAVYRLDNHVATITLDRPQALNSVDIELWQSFSEATGRLQDDPAAWVGVITGAGPKAFSAGADLRSTVPRLLEGDAAGPMPATIMRGQDITKPLIAAVNGLALGGGLEIVLACDIRIASENATFASPEVKLGLIPGWGATQRLPRQIPWAVAARILLVGDSLTADEALAIGLVNAVVPADQLLEEAYKWAARLCLCAPLAVRAAKQAMLAAANLPLNEGLSVEEKLFRSLADTEDLQEGTSAFLEKRQPHFSGR